MAYKGIAHCVRTVAGCLFLCYRRCSQYIGEEDFRERVFGMELKIRAVSEADAEELVEIYRRRMPVGRESEAISIRHWKIRWMPCMLLI